VDVTNVIVYHFCEISHDRIWNSNPVGEDIDIYLFTAVGFPPGGRGR